MPYCEVGSQQTGVDSQLDNGINIFYRTCGHGPTKVLLIIGLAGTHDSWGPQIKGMTGSDEPNDADGADDRDNEAGFGGNGIEVCVFDNRGMGRSSIPTKKSEYTNYGKGCNCSVGSFGLDKSSYFWPFNGSYDSLQVSSNGARKSSVTSVT